MDQDDSTKAQPTDSGSAAGLSQKPEEIASKAPADESLISFAVNSASDLTSPPSSSSSVSGPGQSEEKTETPSLGGSAFTPGTGFKAAGFSSAASAAGSPTNNSPVSPVEAPAPSPVSPNPGEPVPEASTGFVPPAPPGSPTMPASLRVDKGARKKGISKGVVVSAVLVLFLGLSVFGFSKARSILSGATGGGCMPEGLTEANLTSNSIEVTYQTGSACKTSVIYGTSREALLLEVPESLASTSHRVRLSPLLPSTTYYYQVAVEGEGVGPIRSILTKTNQPATSAPTAVPTIIPTAVPTTTVASSGRAATSSAYTRQDFMDNLGPATSENSQFDINDDNEINNADWLEYQSASSSAQ
jgi:hypothetical protein